MARSLADLQAIKAELIADSYGLGLVSPPTIDDVGNADRLNGVGDNPTLFAVDRRAIPVSELAQQIDRTEWNALSAADRQWVQLIMATGSIDVNDTGQVKQGLLQCFGAGTETRAGMSSRMTEQVNGVEKMFRDGKLSIGGQVTPSDISQARQLP